MKLSSMFLLPVSLPSSQRTVLLKIVGSNFEGIENNLDLKKIYIFVLIRAIISTNKITENENIILGFSEDEVNLDIYTDSTW
jgi:hypothetical protein